MWRKKSLERSLFRFLFLKFFLSKILRLKCKKERTFNSTFSFIGCKFLIKWIAYFIFNALLMHCICIEQSTLHYYKCFAFVFSSLIKKRSKEGILIKRGKEQKLSLSSWRSTYTERTMKKRSKGLLPKWVITYNKF